MHGTIRVNAEVIATWSARRLVYPPQEENEYEVAITYTDEHGAVHSESGVLLHRFDDGPLVLVQRVMEWADKQVRLPAVRERRERS